MAQIPTKRPSIIRKYIFTYSTLAYFLFISLLTVVIASGLFVYQVIEMSKYEIRLIEKEKNIDIRQEKLNTVISKTIADIESIYRDIEQSKPVDAAPYTEIKETPVEPSRPLAAPSKKVVKQYRKDWVYVGDKECLFRYDGNGLIPLLDGYGNQKGCVW